MSDISLNDTLTHDNVPTSFGVFKPVGWVMVGLPTRSDAQAFETQLHQAGWAAANVQHFAPLEAVAELQAMVDNAGVLAGFGYELTLLRRYLVLARQGCVWRLVKAEDHEQADRVAQWARGHAATLAVYYRTLAVEELL